MTGYWLIVAHLLGDYVLQNHWMAVKKTGSWPIALLHTVLYTVPFLLIFGPSYALIPILVTHAVIDRYRLARFWVDFWGIGKVGWLPQKLGAQGEDAPPFLGVWLLFIVDNVAHLVINGASLHFLG
jgi:hypothetical protein